jgi:D-alanyl-lipoteichoic acid acyltransferase DltB (MBOAT superfamily)
VAAVAYYLFLYCNFSGFCDIAVGMAGLMGVPVDENFNSPFAADSVKDFWNRWHITLSQYMRDVVFTPLCKSLIRILGPAQANQAIAVSIAVVFLIIGVWHGVGWNYAAFGAMHAVGVVVNHYYAIILKRSLGAKRFAAYSRSRLVEVFAVGLTFCFVAASMFLFANRPSAIWEIVHSLKWN